VRHYHIIAEVLYYARSLTLGKSESFCYLIVTSSVTDSIVKANRGANTSTHCQARLSHMLGYPRVTGKFEHSYAVIDRSTLDDKDYHDAKCRLADVYNCASFNDIIFNL
jgi:hypothetical protein